MRKEIEKILEDFNSMEIEPNEAIDKLLNLHSVSDLFTLEEVINYTDWRDNVPYQFNGVSWVYYDKNNTLTEKRNT